MRIAYTIAIQLEKDPLGGNCEKNGSLETHGSQLMAKK